MKLFLAPMAEITDSVFREISYFSGADFCYSEMISAKALEFNNKKTFGMINITEREEKTFIQLFGPEPENIANGVKILEEQSSCYGIDINMGCPVKKVIKTGAGSALLQSPEKVREIVKVARKNTSRPLSIKIRRGFEEENAHEIANIVVGEGADILVVHPRLRSEMFMGECNYSLSIELAEKFDIKVVHSGDITKWSDIQKFEQSSLYGLMVGRGTMGSPWIFREIKEQRDLSIDEKKEIMVLHFRKILEVYKDERYINLMLRKHAAWYSRGHSGSTNFRKNIMNLVALQKVVIENINSFFGIEI